MMSGPAQKYVYTKLDQIKEGTVVNLYGVVKFFKVPYRSKGTDYCSTVTIMDQSNAKLTCTFFSGNQDTLPKIYSIGDIVRFHRIKITQFNSEFLGISSNGFSALVFEGTAGAPALPRTSSKTYSFTEEDHKIVESLRIWQMGQQTFSNLRLKLSDIKPEQYFNLICHLVGKAVLDKACYLLKVWDGSKCALPAWKVCVEEEALEGDADFLSLHQHLTVDVLVYDNHVEAAKSLKVGSYIVIQNLHAKLHNTCNENQAENSYLEFHLHGGTLYGRGITILPENDIDVQELQKVLTTVNLNEEPICSEDLTSHNRLILPTRQEWLTTPLSTVVKMKPPQKYRVRVRLRIFQPQHLYQSVKLHCTKCSSLQAVPDEERLDNILQGNYTNCPDTDAQNAYWYQSVKWKRNQENRTVTIHFMKKHDMLQIPQESLIMVEGGTFKEFCKLSRKFNSIIPVTCNQANLELDLSAPFLVQGNIWHYGCRNCSSLKSIEALSSLTLEGSWNATEIAKALGIKPLTYVFVMNLTLEDETGSLNAYLWRRAAEQFFQISASEIFMVNNLQEQLNVIMTTLCPPGKSIGEYPWMDCCIKSYHSCDGREEQNLYEIFDTLIS
ncbi:protection of telomeres protein 1 isoform X2 [Rana temporaria]|uniref:protection of telomeres protein 1 isoform X2 n=1 Tax=Rana temporaria TaxID=8407 RepID=UPI001AACBE6C|nr:protection of telomeres protein 1 isoform X2 [Rana temporaria]